MVNTTFYFPLSGLLFDDYGYHGNDIMLVEHAEAICVALKSYAKKNRKAFARFRGKRGLPCALRRVEWDAEVHYGRLLGRIDCETSRELSHREVCALKKFFAGECRGDFGKDFERKARIYSTDGVLLVWLWDEFDGWFMLTEDELKAREAAETVHCKECKHLMISGCYGECSEGHRGIVAPDDTCRYGERRKSDE